MDLEQESQQETAYSALTEWERLTIDERRVYINASDWWAGPIRSMAQVRAWDGLTPSRRKVYLQAIAKGAAPADAMKKAQASPKVAA